MTLRPRSEGTPAPLGERSPVRIRRVPGVPVVAARAWLRGGARLEPIPGLALVTGRLLSEGSRRRSWQRIVTEAEDRGMVISSFGTYDALGVSIDALAADWERALEWLAELVREPSFPEDRFAWVRRHALGELESLMDQPEVRTARAFLEHLYHPHPYSRPPQGDAESLAGLTPADCAELHHRTLGWGGVVAVCGDIDADAVGHRVEGLFPELFGDHRELPEVPDPAGLPEARRKIAAGKADQAHLFAGHLTVPRRHPDRPALDLLAVVLGAGAGLSGRLPERIREREGLAYSTDVATTSGSGIAPGRLVTYVGTSPSTVERAERAIREELERLVEKGVDDGELDEARSYVIGRDPFRRETARQWADLLTEAELYGMPSDRPEWIVERYRALSREEVEAAARRWIRPDELKVTVGVPR